MLNAYKLFGISSYIVCKQLFITIWELEPVPGRRGFLSEQTLIYKVFD